MSKPSYLALQKSNQLDKRIEDLFQILTSCELCARKCGVNRLEGETGYCRSGKELTISSYGPHFGEETPLVGRGSLLTLSRSFGISPAGGSGTVFLTGCNMLCSYCQNYDISHLQNGRVVSEAQVAGYAIELQNRGCHNINFVTPSHFTPQLVKSVQIAAEKGLRLPIVWNCGGYENLETIKLLDGIVDIYMPDIKYGTMKPAKRYSDAEDYFERCKESVKEMHRQVGDLNLDHRGIAYQGLLIRHLVLPNDLAGSERVLRFIAEEISPDSYVNVMSQYRPEGEAHRYEELNRHPKRDEFQSVLEMACRLNLTRGLEAKHLGRFLHG
jgi:putative pyruvate formate lyase activating enzyme